MAPTLQQLGPPDAFTTLINFQRSMRDGARAIAVH